MADDIYLHAEITVVCLQSIAFSVCIEFFSLGSEFITVKLVKGKSHRRCVFTLMLLSDDETEC